MSLPITFHHAASTEFIEASVWYESKRLGLALEFMAVVNVAYRLLLNTLSSMPLLGILIGALLYGCPDCHVSRDKGCRY